MSLKCPYCGEYAKYVDSEEIYGRSFGMMYLCRPCWAYVGVHPGTNRPLGTLANKETREARKKAHAAFDPLWRGGIMRRKHAYERLAEKLGVDEIHVGESDVETCSRIVAASLEILAEVTP